MSRPQLGSKVSVISNLEIRYEGILYHVDYQGSTISLAKARCQGTEDRVACAPVKPGNTMYEFLIFKAQNIKEIYVHDLPKPVLCGVYLEDPAIVQQSFPTMPPVHTPHAPFGHVPNSYDSARLHDFFQLPPHLPTSFPSTNSAMIQNIDVRTGIPVGPTYKKNVSDVGVQVSEISMSREMNSNTNVFCKASNNMGVRNSSTSAFGQFPNTMEVKRSYEPNAKEKKCFWKRRMLPPRMRKYRNNNGGCGQNPAGCETRLKFDGEYDFEKSTAEFVANEKELAKSKLCSASGLSTPSEKGNDGKIGASYSEEKHFFDSISNWNDSSSEFNQEYEGGKPEEVFRQMKNEFDKLELNDLGSESSAKAGVGHKALSGYYTK